MTGAAIHSGTKGTSHANNKFYPVNFKTGNKTFIIDDVNYQHILNQDLSQQGLAGNSQDVDLRRQDFLLEVNNDLPDYKRYLGGFTGNNPLKEQEIRKRALFAITALMDSRKNFSRNLIIYKSELAKAGHTGENIASLTVTHLIDKIDGNLRVPLLDEKGNLVKGKTIAVNDIRSKKQSAHYLKHSDDFYRQFERAFYLEYKDAYTKVAEYERKGYKRSIGHGEALIRTGVNVSAAGFIYGAFKKNSRIRKVLANAARFGARHGKVWGPRLLFGVSRLHPIGWGLTGAFLLYQVGSSFLNSDAEVAKATRETAYGAGKFIANQAEIASVSALKTLAPWYDFKVSVVGEK